MDAIFYYPARIVRAAAPGPLAGLFSDNAALLARYRERYPDSPAENPYFLRTEISNNSLDYYFTHMLTSTLQNFAAGAEAGVGLQDSHQTMSLGYGRSLYGLYNTQPGTPPGWDRSPRRNGSADAPALAIPVPTQYERALAADYIIPGIRLNNLTFASTDDFIRAADAGMVEEISVGFGGGSMACDICGMQYFSWDCPHIAGFVYNIERNDETSHFLATVSVNNAQLLEHSIVYAGATPNAVVIRKAEQEAEAGRLNPKQATTIEQRYQVQLALPVRIWPGAGTQLRAESGRERELPERSNMDELEQIRALLGEANANGETAIEQARWLIGENARLATLADEGRAYRDDLVSDALAEGVRAMGDQFPAETYQEIFHSASLDTIKLLRDRWSAQGDRVLGGQQPRIDDKNEPATWQAAPVVPDAAYKS